MAKVIDLFAGCGGLSLGFIQNGFSIETAVEFDPVIANTYKKNHRNVNVIVDDIQNVDIKSVFHRGDADIIIGGPPCQGFSMAGARIRHGFIDDPRNYLFKHYFNVVKEVKPRLFIMENVKGIATMQNGAIFTEIQRIFSDPQMLDGHPYHLYPRLVKAVDFGIPQKRERMVLIGLLDEIDVNLLWQQNIEEISQDYPDFFNSVTVFDAIGNLPDTSESGSIVNPVPQTNYQRYLASTAQAIENHTKSKHSQLALDRMSRVDNGENYTALAEKINSVHSGSYGRLCWDEQAATITTRFDTPAGGRFTHPVHNRTLSPREAARIQSFPDDFVFYGDKRSISRQIGNAVPPKIAFFLARLAKLILSNGENINADCQK